MGKRILHIITSGLVLLSVLTACSTKKNTSGTRFYHAMTARFNTYFNGSEAFKEGVLEQQKGHKDNYTTLLPMYAVRNKSTAAMGKSNFETAIEKCEKAIKLHSIKARPKSNVNKRKTAKEKAYMARKEFNPFLRHAWLLMGKAQFQQGNFIEAASTFNYISGLYAGQPEIVSVARAYLARCYVELEWPYDAEDVFHKIQRDSIGSEGKREFNASYADYLIFVKQYKEAIPYLQKAIKKEKSKLQRARLNFLLGQLYHETGNKAEAYKALRRVIRANPPYELSFNARILQTEAMASGNHNKMVKKLRRMAKNKKNKDYQDPRFIMPSAISIWPTGIPPGVSEHTKPVPKKVHRTALPKPWYCCVWVRFIGTRRTISTHNAVTPNWSAYWTKKTKLTKRRNAAQAS